MLNELRSANDHLRRTASTADAVAGWSGYLIPLGLIAAWLLVIVGLPANLPIQAASWLTFIALLITPGYFLADIITWRLDIDWLERLALALPLGVAIMAVPGIVALLQHLTISGLTMGWVIATVLVLVAWLLHGIWVRSFGSIFTRRAHQGKPVSWAVDEIILLLLLIIVFGGIIPTLSLYKIDGDDYSVASFAADALTGLPLNVAEPLFGTALGPGVRMVFNQSLPMSYLWSYLAHIDPITLTATASRAMIALWAMLSIYTLGKAAGGGSRRFGLFTASIQLLIYLAAPFVRGDNVSLFFFERINADKFMVPVTMLPVVSAFAIRFARDGRHDAWLAAAVAAFAVSTIHPLVAAMLALALGAFAGLRLLLDLQSRLVWKQGPSSGTWNDPWLVVKLRRRGTLKRSLALWGLVGIVMLLPIMQLVMARGEAPLAASYPSSFDGWPIGQKLVPVLPFIYVQRLDLYGPLPELDQLEAGQTETSANPFLIWRFAVNMNRRRLILFDLDRYISDPSIILEPPYMLALLLLPLLFWRIRSSPATQFAVSTTVAVLFVMFNPVLTPLIGSLVMPWILWRMVWVLPYALIIALATQRLLRWGTTEVIRWLRYCQVRISQDSQQLFVTYTSLGFILVAGLMLSPGIARNIRNLNDRTASPYSFPTPQGILSRLQEVTAETGPVTVLADQDLSVTIPAYVSNANVVAHRAPTTSEIFPADQQDVALQRLIDQDAFYHTPYLTTDTVEILKRYDVRYVVTSSGSDVDLQLRLAPQWFEWLMDDQSYSLYAVRQAPTATVSIQGNSALVKREWQAADELYRAALEKDSADWLALLGLAEVAQAQGQFSQALARLEQIAAQAELPILHYRLGQLYAERGLIENSIVEFDQAQRTAPRVTRFHVALGDACLSFGDDGCAADQYQAAVANQSWSDDALRLIAQADLWRRRGRSDRALPLYEQAVELRPSEYNQFVLASAYRELGQFDRAEAVVHTLRVKHPLSAEVVSVEADMLAAQNKFDSAIALYRHSIWLQEVVAQESTDTRLVLAQLLLEANRLDEAELDIERLLTLSPHSAAARRLQGDLYYKRGQYEQAISAYQRAFALDPTQIAVYVSLSDQLRRHGGRPAEISDLLQTASHINPDEATLLIALGDQFQRLGDPQAAIDAYQAALDTLDPYMLTPQLRLRPTGPSRAFAYARLATAYEDLGQLEPAMNYYHAIVAAAPEIPWTHVMLGDALRQRNDAAGAEAAYLQAVQHDPTYVDAYVRLGDLLNALGNTAEADGLYQQALQIAVSQSDQEQQATVREDIGTYPLPSRPSSLALASGETVEAVAHVGPDGATSYLADTSDPIRQADEIVNAAHALARLYQLHDQADRAIRLYQQKLQKGVAEGWPPTILAQFYKGLGDVYLGQGQLDLAKDAYQQAAGLDNWWPEARLGLAATLSAQGNAADALQHLQAAVEVNPGSVEAQLALASALDQQGNLDQALEIYQNTARAHPGNPRATLALARAWQDRKRRDLAEQSYRETMAMNPGTPDAYLGLAGLYVDQTRYEEAETLLRQAIEIDRQNVNPYLQLFELEQRRGNPERALAWYRQAVARPQAGQAINVTLYDMLLRYGYYETALTYVKEALKLQPDNSQLLFRLGRIQRMLGKYIEAESTLSAARRLDPADSRIYVELAELYLAQGQPRTALVLYQQAIELQPTEESYYLAASQTWATQGGFDQALEVLRKGQTRVAGPTALIPTMSALQMRQGEPERALETLKQGILDFGENASLLLALATYHVSRADFDQAQQTYTRALELEPYAADVHIALADLFRSRGQSAEALDHYQEAIALEPANPGFYLALGEAYYVDGREDEAIEAYSQALALAPTATEAYIALATVYENQERWDDAWGVYEQGLAAAPMSGQLLTRYAALLLERGDEEEALSVLGQATQVAPTATTLIATAAIYKELERVDDAIRDLQIALEKEPGSLDTLLALGDLYREQDDFDSARRKYEEIVSLMPGLPVGYLRLGALANEQGNREEAERFVEAARQAEPGSLVDLDDTQ
ncbi:MAG: tetratricopeptide repeat protein [Anaerolineales bacterium]|nr:MAG: tetratricopeptide repeat protein [Anaerolineales bacterium]